MTLAASAIVAIDTFSTPTTLEPEGERREWRASRRVDFRRRPAQVRAARSCQPFRGQEPGVAAEFEINPDAERSQ